MNYTSKSRLLFPTLSLRVKKALVQLFGGKPGVGLNAHRYQHYFEQMATNTSHVELQNLRPIAAAAQFYSLRVYLQVKQ